MKATNLPANLIGPQVKRQREILGWSEAQLADAMCANGVELTAAAIVEIEGQRRAVNDIEFVVLTFTLNVGPEVLVPHARDYRELARKIRSGRSRRTPTKRAFRSSAR